MNNFAHLKPDCPFYPLFDQGRVPILNWLTGTKADCLGDGVQNVYMVDLARLSKDQFDAVALMVHKQCDPSYPFHKMVAEIRERGLPLRDKHIVSISSDCPAFL